VHTVQFMYVNKAAFTPDTCSPDTSYIRLYPLSPSVSCIDDKIVVNAAFFIILYYVYDFIIK